ncbi:MAG: transporter substrate-binding domain-containing protein [Butyrivibrio sp.]|nr:transporter substrate-binding domain-containing protein [Butyrivibrio sp.]
MKKQLKNFVATVSVLGLTFLSLAGCGAADSASASGTTQTADTSQQTEDTADANTSEEKEKIVITASTMGGPAPFIITNDDGSFDGYDIAVLNALFELDSFKDYELDFKTSTSALVDAQQGLVDFSVNNWSYNEDRAESYYFSYPYTKARYSIVSAKGQPIDSFEALSESGIAVLGSAGGNTTNAVERWNENNPDKQIIIEYTSEDITAQLQKIAAGGFAAIGDDPVWAEYAASYPELFEGLEQTSLSNEETANITEHTTSHLLFGKNSPNAKEYQKLFSEGIKELYDNGTLQELSDKYIGSTTSVVPDESDFEYLN